MRLVDANVLVYAFTTSFPQHERARAWLDERLSEPVPLGLPWPSPTPRHGEILGNLLSATGLRAEHVPDAHLAALALEHGLAVVSADADFSRFPNVRLENPVA